MQIIISFTILLSFNEFIVSVINLEEKYVGIATEIVFTNFPTYLSKINTSIIRYVLRKEITKKN